MVEVEKALGNAGDTWLSLISVPAWIDCLCAPFLLAVATLAGCMWWYFWPALSSYGDLPVLALASPPSPAPGQVTHARTQE